MLSQQYLVIWDKKRSPEIRILFSGRANGERGIWTLAPLLTTYSLSRGAPSATWVLLHLWLNHIPLRNPIFSLLHRIRSYPTPRYSSGESGIRTHAPLRTNGFQDRLVMTTSISLHIHFSVLATSLSDARCILSSNLFDVNTNFYIFSIFFKNTSATSRSSGVVILIFW